MTALVIGVDPGLTTGLYAFGWGGLGHPHQVAAQVVARSSGVLAIVCGLISQLSACDTTVILAVEQFVVGPRAARSATPKGGEAARGIIDTLRAFVPNQVDRRVDVHLRAAAQVKPWATDKRLHAAGLADACKGMPHAKDACRHALFAAVHTGLLRDPLAGKAAGE